MKCVLCGKELKVDDVVEVVTIVENGEKQYIHQSCAEEHRDDP